MSITEQTYIHYGIGCVQCKTHPIKGIRYRCTVCENVNFCANCEQTAQHDVRHDMLKIKINKDAIKGVGTGGGGDTLFGSPSSTDSKLKISSTTAFKPFANLFSSASGGSGSGSSSTSDSFVTFPAKNPVVSPFAFSEVKDIPKSEFHFPGFQQFYEQQQTREKMQAEKLKKEVKLAQEKRKDDVEMSVGEPSFGSFESKSSSKSHTSSQSQSQRPSSEWRPQLQFPKSSALDDPFSSFMPPSSTFSLSNPPPDMSLEITEDL